MKMTYKGWVLGPLGPRSVSSSTAKSPGPAPTPPARLTARQSRIGGDSLPDPHPEVYRSFRGARRSIRVDCGSSHHGLRPSARRDRLALRDRVKDARCRQPARGLT